MKIYFEQNYSFIKPTAVQLLANNKQDKILFTARGIEFIAKKRTFPVILNEFAIQKNLFVRNFSVEHPIGYVIASQSSCFIINQYVRGRLLSEFHSFSREITARCAILLGRIHAAGFTNSDFYPENIIISMNGQPVLLDFKKERKVNIEIMLYDLVTFIGHCTSLRILNSEQEIKFFLQEYFNNNYRFPNRFKQKIESINIAELLLTYKSLKLTSLRDRLSFFKKKILPMFN